MNDSLRALYSRHWQNFVEEMRGYYSSVSGLSGPLLLHVFDEYYESPKKILFVGQLTNGWGIDHPTSYEPEVAVSKSQECYRGFHLGESYRLTPFFRACRELQSRINPTAKQFGFMWSNLVKIDQAAKRPCKDIEEAVCRSFPVLEQEISILKPDVVLFFVGPYYVKRLRETLSGIEIPENCVSTSVECGRLRHQSLPENSFLTYHPHYLMRSKRYERVMDKITESIQG